MNTQRLYIAPSLMAKGSMVKRTLGNSGTATPEAQAKFTSNDTVSSPNSTGAT